MLRRHTRCLQSGAQLPWSRHNRLLYSRRQLHSAFWRHGALDLNLPPWTYSSISSLFEPLSLSVPGNSNLVLYQANALLNLFRPYTSLVEFSDLSFLKIRWYQRDLHRCLDRPSRLFATSPVDVKAATEGPVDRSREESLSASERMNEVISRQQRREAERAGLDTPQKTSANLLLELRSQLKAYEQTGTTSVSTADAWATYDLLPAPVRDARLRKSLIFFLSGSSRTVDAMRVLRLFKSLQSGDHDVSALSAASWAGLKVGDLHEALQLHTLLYDRMDVDDADFRATNALIVNAVSKRQWQLAFHLWDERHKFHLTHREPLESYRDWTRGIERDLHTIPALDMAGSSLVSFVANYSEVLQDKSHRTFLISVISSTFAAGSFSSLEVLSTLVGAMEKLGFFSNYYYEVACTAPFRMNLAPKTFRDVPFKFYYAHRVSPEFKPKRQVIERLLLHAVHTKNKKAVLTLKADWLKFNRKVSVKMARYLMQWHSRRAETEEVYSLLRDHLETELIDPGFFYPLLHTEALRIGASAVKDRLRWMLQEFNLVPDLKCHNILLHAYARFDDLDGALDHLSRMLQAELKLDSYTIGTVMALCAKRGDALLAKSLTRYAVESNIPLTSAIYESLILACINDDNMTQARRLAEQITPDAPAESTRIWTQLITAYAIRGKAKRALTVIRRARELGVPFDGNTYAALMRVFVARKHLTRARHVMRDLMPIDGIEPSAIHYAIMIQGCADEHYFEAGMRMYASMLRSKIKPSYSVQLALLRLQLLAARHKHVYDRAAHPGIRFDVSEELLHEYLSSFDPSLIASKEPEMRLRESTLPQAYPAAYLDSITRMYGKVQGFETIQRLISKYRNKAGSLGLSHETLRRPLQLLYTLMRLRYDQGDHSGVAEIYRLSLGTGQSRAHASSKTIERTASSTRITSSTEERNFSTSDTTARRTDPVPAVHRHLVSRHLDLYLRSLSAQRAYSAMIDALHGYTAAGFALDYLNWNTYIQMLVLRGFIREAFLLCETLLMPGWRGWRYHEDPFVSPFKTATGQRARGLQFIGRDFEPLGTGAHIRRAVPAEVLEDYYPEEMRNKEDRGLWDEAKAKARESLQRPGQIYQVTYRTMVRIRVALGKMKREGGRDLEERELFRGRENLEDGNEDGEVENDIEGGNEDVEVEDEDEDGDEERKLTGQEDGQQGLRRGDQKYQHSEPYSPTSSQQLLDELRERAPKTVSAAENLPGTSLPWVARMLGRGAQPQSRPARP